MKYDYQQTPLWDSNLSREERIDYLLEELTLDEKLQCLGTATPALERLGMTGFSVGGEAAHGVQARHDQSFDKGEAVETTIFPCPIGMSATWDRELIRQAGDVVGKEARAIFENEKGGGKGGLCLWAPTVDMERDPRWGRTEEGYGEDPYLAGKMASSYIQGIQAEREGRIRCGTTLKHFYANNVEEGRVWKSSSIDPRNKYEYYLEPFRRCAVEGGAESLMTAYNEVNGVPAILNREVAALAKEKWGIHHVVCDGGDMTQTVDCHRYFGSHTETVAAGLKAGIDCFTDDLDIVMDSVREALERGLIQESDIDRALRCHFDTLLRLGLFEQPEKRHSRQIPAAESALNLPESQKLSRTVSAESVVLLKNEEIQGEKILPLSCKTTSTLAVIGPLADRWFLDWYSGIPPYSITPYQGICNAWEEQGLSAEEKVYCETGNSCIKLGCGDKYLGLLEDGITLGLVGETEAEIFEITIWDREQVTLRAESNGLLLSVSDECDEEQSSCPGVVQASAKEAFGWFVKEVFYLEKQLEDRELSLERILEEGREITLRSWERQTLFVDGQQRICVGEPEGFVEEETLQKVDSTLPKLYPVLVHDGTRAALETAAKADTVVFVAGAHPMITCKEEKDREDIEFPSSQRSLLKKVFRENPRTVLALISSVPYAITWENSHIPGILNMAGGGMEQGNGLADVLFGKTAPAGRLNMTWYRDTKQLPDMDDYDIIQGERTYQYFRGEVLYPFGYGLTYGETRLEDLQVQYQNTGEVVVNGTVSRIESDQFSRENNVLQDEVVQLYFTKKESAIKRPIRQLIGFQRVKALYPGESRELEFRVPLEDLKYYDTIQRKMLLEPGVYEFQLGKSSRHICSCAALVLEGEERGQRDGLEWQPADHYDRSANQHLWEGHLGCQSVVHQSHAADTQDLFEESPDLWQNVNEVTGGDGVTQSKDGLLLEYDNVALPDVTSHREGVRLILDMEWEGETDIEVYFDGEQIGAAFLSPIPAQEQRHGSCFRQVPIEIHGFSHALQREEGCKSPKTGTLRLEAKGRLSLCRWKFEV